MIYNNFDNIPKNKYKIILADPAWSFNNKNTGGSLSSGSANQYKVMSVDETCNLQVPSISDDNSILFMWWVASQPQEALEVVDAWGFTLKTMTGFTWVKRTKHWKLHFGMGFYSRAGSENCLIAVKGKPKVINHGVRSVIEARTGQHSEKPLEVKKRIVTMMGDLPRIELFARNGQDDTWDYWGNEVDRNS